MEAQVKPISISLSDAIKYAKLVDLADILYKQAVKNNDLATQTNPSLKAYANICNDSTYQLLVDKNFLTNYQVLYNIQVIEKRTAVYFGFIAQDNSSGEYVMAMRGTESSFESIADDYFIPTAFNELSSKPSVPSGFYNLYEKGQLVVPFAVGNQIKPIPLPTVAANPAAYMKDAHNVRTVLTGHSLGATLVTYYAAAVSVGHGKSLNHWLYTYASPMTGDSTFTDAVNNSITESYRIYNKPDVVPTLPIWIGSNGGNIYTQVTQGFPVDSTNNKNVSTAFGCAHQLPVYQYLLEKLNGNDNPNIINAAGGKCRGKG